MDSKKEALKFKNEGNSFLKENKFQEAIDSYTKAIELDENNSILYSNRAYVHLQLENYGLTISDTEKALEFDTNNIKAYYRKGLALMAILRYKEALTVFKKLLEKAPNNELALTKYKQCKLSTKRQEFEKAIAVDFNLFFFHNIDYEKIQIEKLWRGPDLGIIVQKPKNDIQVSIEGLDINYLKYMIKTFKEGGRLPKKHVFAIVTKVYEMFKKEKTMMEILMPHTELEYDLKEHEIFLQNAKKMTIVGDTHGQFYDLLNLFDKFGFVSDEHVYLFNGDFVDRGSWSCEIALYLYVLKIIFPNSVFINRGNHETSDMNKAYGFSDECEHKYSKKIFEAFLESFNSLPLAALINRSFLCMHGGLFLDDNITLEDIKNIDRFSVFDAYQSPKEGLAMELLWTDPQPNSGRSISKRGIGLLFGPDITQKFCLSNKIRKILRSHEVRMQGVEIEHNGRLITIFSAPNYCDVTGNLGGILNISPNKLYNKEIDNGDGYKDSYDENSPWKLDLESFEAVPHPDVKPMAYSKFGLIC